MTLTRRAAIGLALAAGFVGPVAAQEDKGYALGDMALGAEDAPLTVTEYFSYTCNHCAYFHKNTLPEVKKNYIETGKIRMIFREVYYDQYALWASMISRCGGPENYFAFSDTFFDQFDIWARSDDIVGEFQRIARLGGLSQERTQACLTDEAFMQRLIEDYQTKAGADQVNSTPTFVSAAGDKISGAKPYAEFSAWLDEQLAKN